MLNKKFIEKRDIMNISKSYLVHLTQDEIDLLLNILENLNFPLPKEQEDFFAVFHNRIISARNGED